MNDGLAYFAHNELKIVILVYYKQRYSVHPLNSYYSIAVLLNVDLCSVLYKYCNNV
jgi:hypothetical protein